MAYIDRLPLSRRLASLGTAGAIELAIGVALIAGLSTTFVPEDEAPQLTARKSQSVSWEERYSFLKKPVFLKTSRLTITDENGTKFRSRSL